MTKQPDTTIRKALAALDQARMEGVLPTTLRMRQDTEGELRLEDCLTGSFTVLDGRDRWRMYFIEPDDTMPEGVIRAEGFRPAQRPVDKSRPGAKRVPHRAPRLRL